MDESIVEVKLTEEDIPGTKPDEPLEKHAIPELKWWWLCCGIHVPSFLKKQQLSDRKIKINVNYSYSCANHIMYNKCVG